MELANGGARGELAEGSLLLGGAATYYSAAAGAALAVRSLTAALPTGRPSLTRLEPPVRQLRLFRGQPR